MRYLSGEQVSELLGDILHADTQQHDYETDLTVDAVYRMTGPGAVDFGGSEHEPAPREALMPRKRSEEDKYGWWELDTGSYIVRYNEVPTLAANHIAYLQPHERLLVAGATHPTFYFRGDRERLEVLLRVGDGGLNIKENARISKLLVLSLE